MKMWKKAAAAGLAAVMTASLAACGGAKTEESGAGQATGEQNTQNTTEAAKAETASSEGGLTYASVKVGEDFTDLQASIKLLTNRTDMLKEDYTGENWDSYLKRFHEVYPNIEVEIEGMTNYAEDSLLRLQGGDWGDIMMIPAIDKSQLPEYFLSFGTLDEVKKEANYLNRWLFDNQVYGIPSTAVGRGVLYNKKIFKEAGITELPSTTEEFLADLQLIKDKTSAIPLYTNYAAGWTMDAWDDYAGVTASGDARFLNQEMPHMTNPFSDPGDGTHAYNVYKVLYDAVAAGLTEDDYATTDWESSKGKMNSGEIACMVLGSWAFPQMQQAGPNADDIGYMPFPITVDGKRYSQAASDYCYGININSSEDNQKAAMVFIKWMSEESKFSYNEGGLPIAAKDTDYPAVYEEFMNNNVEFIEDEPAVAGEEDLLNTLNADSELMFTQGGKEKVQAIIEHASNQDESFEEIMNEWNQKWSDAQAANGVEVH